LYRTAATALCPHRFERLRLQCSTHGQLAPRVRICAAEPLGLECSQHHGLLTLLRGALGCPRLLRCGHWSRFQRGYSGAPASIQSTIVETSVSVRQLPDWLQLFGIFGSIPQPVVTTAT